MNFLYLQEGANPPSQVLSLSSGGEAVRFSATSSTRWLSVTPASGVAPADLSLAVLPDGLARGVYHSVVTVSAGDTQQAIPVTLFVSGPLSRKPKALRFVSEKGQAPQAQTVQLDDSGAPFTGLATAVSTGTWLKAGPAAGAPGSLQIAVDPEGLKDGAYIGFVTVYYSSFDCRGQRVAASAYNARKGAPPVQTDLTSAPLVPAVADFNGDGLPDLAVADMAGRSLSILLAQREGGFQLATTIPLPESRFPYSVAASDFDGDGKPDVAVSGDSLTLLLGDGAGGFAPAGYSPLSLVEAPGGVPALAIATSTEASALRQVCTSYGGAPVNQVATTSQILAVTLQVGTPPPSTLSNSFLTFDYVVGGPLPLPAQTVTITGGVFSPPSPPPPSWITITSSTPDTFTVTVDPTLLPSGPVVGSYGSSMSIGADSLFITLNITAVAVSSNRLGFSFLAGGPNPPPQTVSLTSNSGPFTASAVTLDPRFPNLFLVTPSGSTPGTLTVSVDPAKLPTAVGFYFGEITVTVSAGNLVIVVDLFVDANLVVDKTSLTFSSPFGGSPVQQSVQVSSSGVAESFLVSPAMANPPNGTWLSVSPTFGTTPSDSTTTAVTVTADPTNLAAGTYDGTITFFSPPLTGGTGPARAGPRPRSPGAPVTVGVTLIVTVPLIATPSALGFSAAASGPTPTAQTVSVAAGGGAAGPASIPFTATPSAAWLLASPSSGTTPGSFSVSVNPTGLAPGTYNGTITVSSPLGSTTQTVTVTLTVTAALFAAPATLAFTFATGGATPAPQTLSVTSSPSGVALIAATSAIWLAVSPPGTTPASPSISVNPAGLAPGTYNGTVSIGYFADLNALQIPVSLTVSAGTFSAQPSSLAFTFAPGGATPAAQSVSVAAAGGVAAPFTAASSASWLAISPASGTTPASLSVSVNPTGLAPGTYNGNVTVSAPGASNGAQTVAVTLTVTSTLLATPAALAFNFATGGATPAAQPVSVTSSNPSGVSFTATSSANWLVVNPSGGTTPASLSVSVNPAGLAPGTYNGSLTVNSPSASQTVAVTLTVTSTLSATPATLAFSFATGGSIPAAQTVAVVASSPSGIPFTATSSAPWLVVSPSSGNTPGSLNVSVNPTGVAPGTYAGTVTVNSSSASNGPQTVSVTLTVTATLSATPASLAFTFATGGATPAPQTVSVGASVGAAVPFTVTSSATWLVASPASGATPASLSISVNPAGLAPGTYRGTITINSSSASNGPQTVSVSLTVAPTLSAAPSTITFTVAPGAALPLSQPVSVSAAGGGAVAFTAASSAPWLVVSPASGTTPASLSVSVNLAGVAPGTYTGTVTVNSSNGSQSVTVNLFVSAPLFAAPGSLRFTYVAGGASPAAQAVSVSSERGASIPYTATSTAAWLAVSPAGGDTPGSLSVSVNPTGLPPGTYDGSVTVDSPFGSNGTQTVAVTLTVVAPLSATPSSLAFSLVLGGAAPAPQTISVAAGGVAIPFTAVSSDTWLAASPTSGTTPGSVNVSVRSSGLAAGTYSGAITIDSGASSGSRTVAVTLTVTAPLTVSPATVSFSSLTAGSGTPTQQVLAASGGAPISIAAVAATTSGGAWLSATPATAITPASITVGADMTGLLPGTYLGTVTISSAQAAAPQTISVTLVVVAGGDLVLSPSTLTFTANTGAAPISQTISVTSSTSVPLPFSVSSDLTGAAGSVISVTSGKGTTPALVTVTADPASLPAGSYGGHVRFSALQKPYVADVSLTLKDSPPVLSVGPTFMDFRPPSGSTAVLTQALQIQNTGGGGTQPFSVGVTDGSWLSVSPATGTLTGNRAAAVQVSVNPQGLAPGPYLGSIRVQMGNSTQDVSVSLLVISSQPYIGLEFLGVQFEARTGEGLTYTRDVSVFNRGGGTLNWTATVLSGGDWLSLNQKQGKFTLTTKPGNLAPKAYYATVQIADANATNSPQLLTVVLNVLPATAQAAPLPSPGGLLFVAAGGAAPAAQTVQIFTSSTAPVSFQAAAQAADGANWLSVSPASDVTSTAKTGSVTVTVNPAGLKAGVYQGGVSFSISGIVRTTNVTLIVTPSGASAPNASKGSPMAAGCAATKLVPVYTGLVNNFSSPAGWPTPVTVQLVDDCGSAVANGNIVLNFSKGQPGFLTMNQTDSVNAIYTATWVPASTAAQINVVAKATAGPLQGTAQVSGAVSDNAVPVLFQNGTRHQYNQLKEGLPLAPGTIVSIYGSNLAQDSASPSPGALPTELKGTQVLIGGRAAPLYYVSKGLINAQVPVELEPHAGYQVVVSVNGAISVPDALNLVPAQPGVVAFDSGQVVAQHSSDFRLVTSDAPAAPGEALIIYLAGMGATDPAVQSGAPSPSDPLASAKLSADVTLDGQPVKVLYAGLAPFFVGLYQINFVVPQNAAIGNLKLTITQDGRETNATTLPVRNP